MTGRHHLSCAAAPCAAQRPTPSTTRQGRPQTLHLRVALRLGRRARLSLCVPHPGLPSKCSNSRCISDILRLGKIVEWLSVLALEVNDVRVAAIVDEPESKGF